MENDQKILVIAAAVLALILVTLLIFGALYRSFVANYARAYDSPTHPAYYAEGNQSHQSQNPDPAASRINGPVQIKLNNHPVGGYADPSAVNMTDDSEVPSPTVQETNIDNTNDVFEPFEEDTKMDFGNTVVQDNQDADDDWTIEQPQGNEFFSADEQARIWQELREAESNAATNEPSATDKAKAAARSAAGDYIVPDDMAQNQPQMTERQMAESMLPQPVEVSNSDDAPFDSSAQFYEAPVSKHDKSNTLGGGYIDPSDLAKTGASYVSPIYGVAGDMSTAEMGVNADNEWWK